MNSLDLEGLAMDGNGRRLDFDSDILNSDLTFYYLYGLLFQFKFGMNVNFN